MALAYCNFDGIRPADVALFGARCINIAAMGFDGILVADAKSNYFNTPSTVINTQGISDFLVNCFQTGITKITVNMAPAAFNYGNAAWATLAGGAYPNPGVFDSYNRPPRGAANALWDKLVETYNSYLYEFANIFVQLGGNLADLRWRFDGENAILGALSPQEAAIRTYFGTQQKYGWYDKTSDWGGIYTGNQGILDFYEYVLPLFDFVDPACEVIAPAIMSILYNTTIAAAMGSVETGPWPLLVGNTPASTASSEISTLFQPGYTFHQYFDSYSVHLYLGAYMGTDCTLDSHGAAELYALMYRDVERMLRPQIGAKKIHVCEMGIARGWVTGSSTTKNPLRAPSEIMWGTWLAEASRHFKGTDAASFAVYDIQDRSGGTYTPATNWYFMDNSGNLSLGALPVARVLGGSLTLNQTVQGISSIVNDFTCGDVGITDGLLNDLSDSNDATFWYADQADQTVSIDMTLPASTPASYAGSMVQARMRFYAAGDVFSLQVFYDGDLLGAWTPIISEGALGVWRTLTWAIPSSITDLMVGALVTSIAIVANGGATYVDPEVGFRVDITKLEFIYPDTGLPPAGGTWTETPADEDINSDAFASEGVVPIGSTF